MRNLNGNRFENNNRNIQGAQQLTKRGGGGNNGPRKTCDSKTTMGINRCDMESVIEMASMENVKGRPGSNTKEMQRKSGSTPSLRHDFSPPRAQSLQHPIKNNNMMFENKRKSQKMHSNDNEEVSNTVTGLGQLKPSKITGKSTFFFFPNSEDHCMDENLAYQTVDVETMIKCRACQIICTHTHAIEHIETRSHKTNLKKLYKKVTNIDVNTPLDQRRACKIATLDPKFFGDEETNLSSDNE